MSESTNTLLPEANVALHTQDAETRAAFEALAQDWRFARVKFTMHEGNVLDAAKIYQTAPSPDMLIVQTENIDESFPERLATLASQCEEGTSAVVIGPVNDVYLYRKLIDMGVSDYLVKPVEKSVLAEIIAKGLIEKKGLSSSALIGFLGAKGGVGTSVMAQAAAWGASDLMGQKTLLLDGAGGWSSLSVGMGFEPSTTLNEAVRMAEKGDEESFNRILFQASDKLHVLASGGDVMLESSISPQAFETLLGKVMQTYPIVIADLSHAPTTVRKAVMHLASQIVVVSTPTLPALRLARALIQEIRELRGEDEQALATIINMSGQFSSHEVPKNDLEQALGFPVSGLVPFDQQGFIRAESQSEKITANTAGEKLVREQILPVLERILGPQKAAQVQEENSGLFGGLLGKLKN